MAGSVDFGSVIIWKAGILSPGRGRVNNTFALGVRASQWRARPNAAAPNAC